MTWSWKNYRRSKGSHTLAQTDLTFRPAGPVKYRYLADYPVGYTLKVPKRHPPREK
jgi:hypothetical protein